MSDFSQMGARAAGEIAEVLARVDPQHVRRAVDMICSARRIALYGVGREGLMMKGLAMRLFHLGLDAHVVGEMTTPPLGAGDLLIVSAGPGGFSTVTALLGVARNAGAHTLCVTARPEGESARAAEAVLRLPAQTMADDLPDGTRSVSVLPMGSLFEGVQYVAFELLVLALRDRLGETAQTMRDRHTNLE
ncbi:SIS domain-containing protein [Chelativorans intermedius]|uniref:SIS domain-containing protein n=1 Tax=Chelativorans intermedius TaxID=515947 RepID=A0ABV6D6D3_9HYPH|nr:SIS domain-containing protein [Chelativorans intermedius]MCT8999433.1 SIS domain-containing protein [Chelativorans intermedius]